MSAEGRGRRLHPATLLFDVGRRLGRLAFWTVAVLFFAARSQELWYLLFLLPPVVNALFRYFSFRYAFTDDHLVIREGVLVRSVRHVPYARVQNIDTLQGPLHRLLGVVEVRLETAAGSEPEAVFQVISSAQLLELRAGVLGPRAGSVEASARPAGPVEAPFFRMRTEDVLLFGLFSQKGLLYVGGFLVAVREFASWEKVEERLGTGFEVLSQGSRLVGPLGWLALAILFLLLLQILTILWALVTLFGFRIERAGEDLRTTCGLFTRQTASLPRGRVQFLEVRASPLQRLLGRVSVRALSAGGDSTQDSQVARKWLVPLCPRAELAAILAEVQPEAALDGLAWQRVHPRALRRLAVKWALSLELLVAATWWHSWWLGLVASVSALTCAVCLARLRVRSLGWALGERAIFLRDGVLARRLACVRFEKIQSIELARSPLDRRARMARLSVDTAAPSGSDLRLVVPFLGLREACALQRRLRREAAAVRFRW